MSEYDLLSRLGGEQYANIVAKINQFHSLTNELPNDVNELESKFPLTISEKYSLIRRAKLERKFNQIQTPRLLMLQTHDTKDDEYLSDNNQIIFAEFGYRIDEFERKSDFDLGLVLINDDVKCRKKDSRTKWLGINARILHIRGENHTQLIKYSYREQFLAKVCNSIKPIYQIKTIYSTPEEILKECEKQGLTDENLVRISYLVSKSTQDFLREMENSKLGVAPHHVKKVHSKFMALNSAFSWKEFFSRVFA